MLEDFKMNKNMLIITMFIVLGISFANAQDFSSQDVLLINNVCYVKGSNTPYTGKIVDKYPNGSKQQEVVYKYGKQDGVSTQWYKDGAVKSKSAYVDGKHNGGTIWWQPNGKKRFEAHFKNGREYGVTTEWLYDGKKASELDTRDGIVYGFVSYDDGRPFECHKDDGSGYTGAITTKHEDGIKQCVRHYENGKLNGLKKCWLSDGKMYTKEDYKDGKLIGE
jgi:antitoxin component YwqK of YwqJK toxin-antitoxin module